MANHHRNPVAASPLWAVLAFTFLNSLGSGVVTTGFAFLARSAYGFQTHENYLLGLGQGLTYIAGALGVGPVLARLGRRSSRFTARAVLAGLMIALAALCALPWFIRQAETDPGDAATWPFWLLVLGYSALTGVLWPIVESYMSGGRSGHGLRSAMGLFNVVWSSALVVAYVGMGPLVEPRPLEVILAVGIVHLGCLGLLPLLASKPAAHLHDDHGPVPPIYPRLLSIFRMQLPASYMVYSALTPFLPLACTELGIPKRWQTPLVATWLASRLATFAILQRWHAWHGRWATAWVGSLFLLSGFGVAVLSTTIAPAAGRSAGIAALTLGLAAFGIGKGIIYFSALYYAMSVGNAEVDAGGKHEALIGLGYGAGPICGLAAIAAADAGWLAPGTALGPITGGQFELLMLILVALAAAGIVVWSLLRAAGHASHGRAGRNPPAPGV